MGNGKTRQMRWKKNYELVDPDAPKKDEKEAK